MKITQKQLKDLIKEEYGPKNKKQKSMLLEAPSPENEVFSDIIGFEG